MMASSMSSSCSIASGGALWRFISPWVRNSGGSPTRRCGSGDFDCTRARSRSPSVRAAAWYCGAARSRGSPAGGGAATPGRDGGGAGAAAGAGEGVSMRGAAAPADDRALDWLGVGAGVGGVAAAAAGASVAATGSARAGLSAGDTTAVSRPIRSEEHTSELQSLRHLVCRLLLVKKNENDIREHIVSD